MFPSILEGVQAVDRACPFQGNLQNKDRKMEEWMKNGWTKTVSKDPLGGRQITRVLQNYVFMPEPLACWADQLQTKPSTKRQTQSWEMSAPSQYNRTANGCTL